MSTYPPDFSRWSQEDRDAWFAAESRQYRENQAKHRPNGQDKTAGVGLDDFYAHMPSHSYIFAATGEMWPGASINSRIPPIEIGTDEKGKPKTITASSWLDKNRSVEQMTWAPGEPMLIKGKLIAEGGWIERDGVATFNLYKPPVISRDKRGSPGPWLDHIGKIYPDDGGHIINWLAHRVQFPAQKINHALVLGGLQGIGKDTLLQPVKYAVGPWNFQEISPIQAMGRFNGFVKSVILRVSEARDQGEFDRFKFYDHLKSYTASPPDVLRVDQKHINEYSVLNCCGVIITTNYKTDGIYLPADDRRHYIAWSELTKDDFSDSYWNNLWRWYRNGGIESVALYLRTRDISKFDPKAPPPKTAAFWAIANANQAPENAEMADLIDALGNPRAVTLERLISRAKANFMPIGDWLEDRKNRRAIPHRLEECGYVQVPNDTAKSGLWVINGKRQIIYARKDMPVPERHQAARELQGD
jgi:hypothetical protein